MKYEAPWSSSDGLGSSSRRYYMRQQFQLERVSYGHSGMVLVRGRISRGKSKARNVLASSFDALLLAVENIQAHYNKIDAEAHVKNRTNRNGEVGSLP